jgi:DNA repair/transcription protein MET18/MMS19
MISCADSVCQFIISQIVPHLVGLFMNLDELDNRPHILALLSDLVTSASKTKARHRSEFDSALLPFKDEVLSVVIMGLKSSLCRRSALDALQGMVTTNALLTDDELVFIVHNVNEVLETDLDDGDSR